MQVVETKVYTFGELSERAKEKAREWWREGLWSDGFAVSDITEMFQHELELLGYPTDNIQWSLSCSQGDGMAFYGKIDTDGLRKIAKRVLDRKICRALTCRRRLWTAKYYPAEPVIDNLYATIERVGMWRYNHWNTMRASVGPDGIDHEVELPPHVLDAIEALQDGINEEVKEVSRRLERIGYNEIEYQESNEVVDENIRANEYTFDENGHRFG